MKTSEDEAFDELARKQGAWGGGFPAKRAMAADKLWDKPSVAFDEWWNGDNDESTNPFRLESGAYWAWAGWKAALAQPAQEPVAWLTNEELTKLMTDSYDQGVKDALESVKEVLDALPKREWVGLTAEDFSSIKFPTEMRFPAEFRAGARWADVKLKEKNT